MSVVLRKVFSEKECVLPFGIELDDRPSFELRANRRFARSNIERAIAPERRQPFVLRRRVHARSPVCHARQVQKR
jgi:hypothetical protein